MQIRLRALLAAALVAVACIAAGAAAPARAAGVPPWPDRVHLFDYTTGPLAITELGVVHRAGVDVHDITYAEAGSEPVSAFLVVPTRAAPPYAAVLWAHWLGFQSSRAEFVDEAVELARRGVVSLLPQGTFPWFFPPVGGEADVQAIVSQVVNLRRGLDLLSARADVDPSRIGFVGHDYGAMYGSLAVAVDGRVHTEVLMSPDATFFHWFNKYWIGYEGAQAAAYDAMLAPYDPIQYVGHAPAGGIFLQFSRHDQYVSPGVRHALFEAASQPSRHEIYQRSGHHLNGASRADRDAWLISALGL